MPDIVWQPIWGNFQFEGELQRFIGEQVEQPAGPQPSIGVLLSDQSFSGGSIEVQIKFSSAEESACEVVLYYDPESKFMVTAGLGGGGLFSIRHWGGNSWFVHGVVGDRKLLRAEHLYRVKVTLRGSAISLVVDGVQVLVANIPYHIPQGQVGMWFWSASEICISGFNLDRVVPRAFVIMPFSSPYDEIYEQVIKGVCSEVGLEALRVDEAKGPGVIIADIAREIRESSVVIADITAPSCNVYYEVGFSHAANKPTVLLAHKGTQLPFDVAPYRTLYYENTIGGKDLLEDSLRKHLGTILREWYGTEPRIGTTPEGSGGI